MLDIQIFHSTTMLIIESIGTMVAPICWVIAPASATTEDPLIRSRRDVFP